MSKQLLILMASRNQPVHRHAMFQAEDWQETLLVVEPGMLAALATVKDASVDGIWCMHLLATVPAAESVAVLAQCQRILKPDGIMASVVFDAEIAGRHIAQGKLAEPVPANGPVPMMAMDMLYGKQGEYRQCFTALMLGKYLREAGFKNIQVSREQIFLWASAIARPSRITGASDKIRINDTHRPLGLPDHLSAPPQQWKPLGLL